MSVPPALEAEMLLYHWYERVPPSVTEAVTVKVTVPAEGITVDAAGWPDELITGVCASSGTLAVTFATELALLVTFAPSASLLVFVITQ
jgi:hypothetical protein